MIIHYLKITWRQLVRRSGFSLLNMLGLTVGLAACIFIFQYVSFERGFNRQFTHIDELYRVLMVDDEQTNTFSPAALAPIVQSDVAQVRAFSRILSHFSGTITFEQAGTGFPQTFTEQNGLYADGNLLEVLGHPLKDGTMPYQPYTLALSESKAAQYFGETDPIGQVINLHNQFGQQVYTVSAVFPDLPLQSDFQFDLLFSIKSFEHLEALNLQGWAWLGHWHSWVYETILQLEPEANLALVERSLNSHQADLPETFSGSIRLQPLSELHLGAGPEAAFPSALNARYINFLFLLGLLILAIAWINYVNLSIAQSLQRIRSLGMQRIVGANRRQIWGQYLTEAATFNLLALVLALTLVIGTQAFINRLIDLPLGFSYLEHSQFLYGILVFIFAGILVSGIYVAVVLAAFHPMEAVKGILKNPGRKSWVGNSMLVFQLAVSTGLILGTAFMFRQLQFMQHAALGADLDQVVLIPGPKVSGEEGADNLDGFQSELEKQSFIQEISFSGLAPGEGYNYQAPGLVSDRQQEGDDELVYVSASIDENYFDLYRIPVIAGRNFRGEEVASFSWYDIEKVVLNETAAKRLRFESPEAAVGQFVTWGGSKRFEVVGVVADHHHMSLQQAILPMVFLGSKNFSLLGLRLNTGDLDRNLGEIGALYSRFFPGNPFEYFFADENFARQYTAQQRSAGLFGIACALAVFIACLGLLGLSIASVRQRTKEVGIRRILGATAAQLVMMLSRDYLIQVLLAFLLATPVVYWLVGSWLEDFAYRITLEGWVFAAGGLAAIVLAFFTVGSQALRAVLSNPVNSLRNE